MTVYAIFMTASALGSAVVVALFAKRNVKLQQAMHKAADELDDWDPHPSTILGGASPGGVVRFHLHKAAGYHPSGLSKTDHGRDCPFCRRGY